MAPRHLAQLESTELRQSFPNITSEHARITLEVGEDYNCVAYAVDETEHYEPGSVAEMRRFMNLRGYRFSGGRPQLCSSCDTPLSRAVAGGCTTRGRFMGVQTRPR